MAFINPLINSSRSSCHSYSSPTKTTNSCRSLSNSLEKTPTELFPIYWTGRWFILNLRRPPPPLPPRPRPPRAPTPRRCPAWSWTRRPASRRARSTHLMWVWVSPPGCWRALCPRRRWQCPWTTCCTTPSPWQTTPFSDTTIERDYPLSNIPLLVERQFKLMIAHYVQTLEAETYTYNVNDDDEK